MALAPQPDEFQHDSRWIFQIAVDLDRGISRGMAIASQYRAVEAEITGIAQCAHARIARRDLLQYLEGRIGGMVIGENEFDFYFGQRGKDLGNFGMSPLNVALLIINRQQDRNQSHCTLS